MGDIIIRYIPMPATIKAYTLTDDNDDFNVYVNSTLNSIQQKKAVEHELRHIKADHFYRDTSVCQDEKEAEKPFFRATGEKVKVRAVEIKPNPRKDIKKLRQNKGLTQYQTAKLAGISPSLYAQYEQGTMQCSESDEEKIMKVLGEI